MTNKLDIAHDTANASNIRNIQYNYLKNLELETILTGTIVTGRLTTTNYHQILFDTAAGRFTFDNIVTDEKIECVKDDQLTIQVKIRDNQIIADIILYNNKPIEGFFTEQRINHDYAKLITSVAGQNRFIEGDDIISIKPHNSLEAGTTIKFNIIYLNISKLVEVVDNLQQSTITENTISIASNDGLMDFIEHNILTTQLKILINQLSNISNNSELQAKLVAIDTVQSSTDITIENDKLILQVRLTNDNDTQMMFSNFAIFKTHLYIPINERTTNISLEITDIINNEYEDNIPHLDDFSQFLKDNIYWPSLERSIGKDTAILKLFFAVDILPIPKLDEFMLAKLIDYEQHITNNSLLSILEQINNNYDMQQIIDEQLSKDLANINDVNKYLVSESSNAWQFIFIPILNHESIEYLKIFTRQESEQLNKKRFVLEFYSNLTGKAQCDGAVIYDTKMQHVQQVNLTIRSQTALAITHTDMIQKIFQSNQLLFGIKGFIKFEQVSEFICNPANEILSQLLVRDKKLI